MLHAMKPSFRKKTAYTIQFFHRPGRCWSDDELARFNRELNDIAADCFRQVPRYQCLTGNREELKRNVITIARDNRGDAVGFCSAVILEVDGYENILHLGLTCIKKSARSMGLTHRLTSKLVMLYLFKTSFFKAIWITNVACVLSSLGNIALHFENVFPSPFGKADPSPDHLRIAKAIDEQFRGPVAINPDSVFDERHFVFRGSVDKTVFQKSAKDTRYYHRNPNLTHFYKKRMNFKNGDEVVQVAKIGVFSYPKYKLKKSVMGIIASSTHPIRRMKTAFFSRKF